MNKYDGMSDKQIDAYVTKLVYDLDDWEFSALHNEFCHNDGTVIPAEDFCTNPADMWPIIVDNSITINYDTCQAHVSSYFNEAIKISVSKNRALRAAAIVFLMMQEAK